jgi:hypothetical protein
LHHKHSHNKGLPGAKAPAFFAAKGVAMKRFPEKTVMAVIILSCGFVLQTGPSQHKDQVKVKQMPSAAAHTWRVSHPTENPTHPTKTAKAFDISW